MNDWDTVAIVGVGLIGGSIGLDLLQRRLARRVIGIGRRQASLRTAKQAGAVTSTTLKISQGVADADLVIVCTPVGRIADDVLAAAAAAKPSALITDAGSTKQSIVQRLDRELPRESHFVGSHPLAGSEKSGPAAAVAGLFEGRTVVITPSRRTAEKDTKQITRFWESLGARVVPMTPAEHDKALAAVSHLPHVVAAALVSNTTDALMNLAAGGWTDTTRIAAGDEQLWTQILLDNRRHVLSAIGRYNRSLESLRRAIERGDAPALERLLATARGRRELFNQNHAKPR